MIRRIIQIDKEKCNGCGACANACHEGAIGMVDGKAELLRDDYCDGLGDCLPTCPTGAITFVEREAAAYDEAAVKENMKKLQQWPVQIKLVPTKADYFDGAKLLVAADCCAYAYGNFHEEFIKDHITLVGCQMLDGVDYSEKLTEIIRNNDIKSVTVTRMQVPCCGGIEQAVKKALQESGKLIPWQIVTISAEGQIVDRS